MIGSILFGFLVAFGDIVSGLELKKCYWSAFNREYSPSYTYVSTNRDYQSVYFATTKFSGNTARIWLDTTTYNNGDWWIVGWGYNGNEHQMACGQSSILHCQAGDWWYWYNGWHKDAKCAVYDTSDGAATGSGGSSGSSGSGGSGNSNMNAASSSGTAIADGQAQGPIPIESGDDAQSFDDFIPIIIGSAIGIMVVTAIVTVVVVKRKRKRVSDEQEVEMKEVVSAPTVSPVISTDGVDDTM